MRFNRFARPIVASCLIAFILLAVPGVAQQQRLQVIRNVRLHTEPSSTSPKVRTLEPPEIVTRVSAGNTNNYIRVRTSRSELGWVYRHRVSELARISHRGRSLA